MILKKLQTPEPFLTFSFKLFPENQCKIRRIKMLIHENKAVYRTLIISIFCIYVIRNP